MTVSELREILNRLPADQDDYVVAISWSASIGQPVTMAGGNRDQRVLWLWSPRDTYDRHHSPSEPS